MSLNKKSTTIILEIEQLEWLRDEAYKERVSQSEVIRKLIEIAMKEGE